MDGFECDVAVTLPAECGQLDPLCLAPMVELFLVLARIVTANVVEYAVGFGLSWDDHAQRHRRHWRIQLPKVDLVPTACLRRP